jgi:SAM-dependent methyltransferase
MRLSTWYDAVIVPRVIRCACGAPGIMGIRKQIVPLAQGLVLELGCGGGINQAFYDPQRVSKLVGVDPSQQGLVFAEDAARPRSFKTEFIKAEGESLPFGGDTFDSVVCTYTLCSVHSPAVSLAELPDRTHLEAIGWRLPSDSPDQLRFHRCRVHSRRQGCQLSCQNTAICRLDGMGHRNETGIAVNDKGRCRENRQRPLI